MANPSDNQPGQPDWSKIAEAGQRFLDGLNQLGIALQAQAALGWALKGDEDKAKTLLAGMPEDYVKLLSLAARALADLADEDVANRE